MTDESISQQMPARYRTYPPETEAQITALQEAVHNADSMLIIEEALNRATLPGDRWPQNSHTDADYPNPAFGLAIAHLLTRDPVQARACLGYAGWRFDA